MICDDAPRHYTLASLDLIIHALTQFDALRGRILSLSSVFHASKPSSPILIYLPPGPVLSNCAEQEDRVISALRASSSATVVRIGYRASSVYKFPTPYHDVLYGYDWILENLLRDEFQRPYQARLGVCGELIGGSIATMMALTECRTGESRIAAVAVNSPIVDWVFPDDLPLVGPSDLPEPLSAEETAFPAGEDMAESPNSTEPTEPSKKVTKRKKRTPKKQPQTSWQAHSANSVISTMALSKERDVLFQKPEDYFDRFASPIHFFRSPHAQMVAPMHEDFAAVAMQLDLTLDMEAQMSLSHFESFNTHRPEPRGSIVPMLTRCRSYARSYPQAGTKLNLPAWNIATGSQNPLHDQTLELHKVVRRSLARYTLKLRNGRTKWHDAAEKEAYKQFAEERVLIRALQGTGLWCHQDNNPSWEEDLKKVGSWMKQNLETDSS
jgi:acetyl esterase/lipase